MKKKCQLYQVYLYIIILLSPAIVLAQPNQNPSVKYVDKLNQLADSLSVKYPRLSLEYSTKASELAKQENYYEGMARALFIMGEVYYYRYLKDSALHYYKRARSIAEVINYDELAGDAHYCIAHTYYETDQYDLAIEHAQLAEKIYRDLDLKVHVANVMGLLCQIYNYKGENDIAISHCINCIQLYDELGQVKYKSNILNVIGNIYMELKSYHKAHQYLEEAYQIAKASEEIYDQATTMNSLGEMYFDQDSFALAYRHFKESFQLDQQVKDTLGIAYSAYALGKTLIRLDSIEKGLDYLDLSLELAQKVKDRDLQANVFAIKGEAYSQLEEFTTAIFNLRKSQTIAEEINAFPILKLVNKNLAQFYETLGEYPDALEYYKKYIDYSEKITNRENTKQIAEIESIYDLAQKEKQIELKEKQIALLQKENEIQLLQAQKRNLLNKELIAAVIFIFIIALVLYSRNRLKNKANKILQQQAIAINQQKEEIEKQKQDIESQNVAISEINEQITASIEYAKKIQLSLFPGSKELKTVFPESFVFSKPKDIISGDFYWFNSYRNKVYLAVVDCTGHGVPGAFMTVLASSLLNQVILESKISSPELILTLLDLKLKQNLHQKNEDFLSSDGMDIALCVIDQETCQVEFSGARFPFYFVNGHGLQQMQGDRYPVGSTLFQEKKYSLKSLNLKPGDTIYLATDGYQDQFGGEKDTKFMKSSFKKLLNNISKSSIPEQFNQLTDTFYQWKGVYPQTDDILVIGIKLS
ncbi:MAG: tetratricopeptide repeat protein [Candidatus Cyclobacteriaceae bacterium M3_2C_046]